MLLGSFKTEASIGKAGAFSALSWLFDQNTQTHHFQTGDSTLRIRCSKINPAEYYSLNMSTT
jgi:hypothetical protein